MNLPTETLRTVPDPKRVRGGRGPLAWLFEQLVPPGAVSWGELTHEDDGWHAAAGRWQTRAVQATVVRPCPAFQRLDALMSGGGKATADAFVPAQFSGFGR